MKNPTQYSIYTLLVGFSLISTQALVAQNVNIPDANFKAYLLGNSSINTNLDTEIQVSEASSFSGGIFAGTQSISNLTGIEAFTSLTILDVSQNALTSMDLTYNTALTTLNCSLNSLTCLDLSYNPAITSLECGSNALTSLNVKNGNNVAITNFNAIGAGISLFCIQVDNAAYSTANWNNIDGGVSFSSTCGSLVTASFTSNNPVCFGTPVDFVETATNETEWLWDFGDGATTTVQNPNHVYASTGSYTVTLIARNCNSRDTVSNGVIQGTNMYGTASYSGGNVTSGTAILYPYTATGLSFDTLQIQPLDAFGNFIFGHIQEGNYLVQIYPDTLLFPNLVPTYHDSAWVWDSATVHVHDCINDSYPNVIMTELTPSSPGPGLMQGYIIEGPGFGRNQGDPIHGVAVKRGIAATAQIVETTFTDLNGQYTFNNLEFGTYTIYVDIPGLLRDSVYTITLDGTTNQFPNLYYVVDSTRIYIEPGIGIEDFESSPIQQLDVFPNPVKDLATIRYSIAEKAYVQMEIYTIWGNKIQTLTQDNQVAGEYNFNLNTKSIGIKPGIYFVSLTANGKRKTVRLVVLE
jgi:PKD repeat protein